MTIPDQEAVEAIIRAVSERIIMPGFHALEDSHVFEKRPGELVTEVDIAAENLLSDELCALVPDSKFLGEECYEDNHALMDLMDTDGPVWVVDPIDGTGNFSRRHKCFAVMVAYRLDRETIGGWIYDPVSDSMVSALKGNGAYTNGKRLYAAGQGISISKLAGSLGTKMSKRLDSLSDDKSAKVPQRVKRYRTCGREYMDLALGTLQFVQYGVNLKPWDHAPGVLIAQEAGYHAAFLEDGSPYDATGGIHRKHLLVAPDEAAWKRIHDLLWV